MLTWGWSSRFWELREVGVLSACTLHSPLLREIQWLVPILSVTLELSELVVPLLLGPPRCDEQASAAVSNDFIHHLFQQCPRGVDVQHRVRGPEEIEGIVALGVWVLAVNGVVAWQLVVTRAGEDVNLRLHIEVLAHRQEHCGAKHNLLVQREGGVLSIIPLWERDGA